MLVGAPSLELSDSGRAEGFNSAVLYRAGGARYAGRYDKMHLVPFGEVVPFRDSWPWLYRLLNSFTPYDYEYTLAAGSDAKVFSFERGKGVVSRFAVAICYEDVMPQVVRRLAGVEDGGKRIDFLVNISNDGWFVRGESGQVRASSELIQHLVICKFRAIENRIGIVRAVNTGISGFIRPDGVVQEKPLAGTLSEKVTEREAVAGYLTDRVYRDERITVYSKIGDAFAVGCAVLSGLFLLSGLGLKAQIVTVTKTRVVTVAGRGGRRD